MGLALLQWEKLPAWVLGPLLIILGAFQLFSAEPFSWHQLGALAIFVIGVWLFISGMKKLLAEPSDARFAAPSTEVTDNADEKPATPDFGKYTEAELRQILSRLDGERFPDRAKEIEVRLASYDSK